MAGIYLHIPFCKQACHYCDFHFSTSLRHREEMIKSILREITLQKDYLNEQIETIYLGGGTPSLLRSEEINALIDQINQNFSVNPQAEITLEANPDDLDAAKLHDLKLAGINRLSIGIQSFHDHELQWMNRAHNAKEAMLSIDIAREVGIENFSIDLIYGVPNSTAESWRYNLEQAMALKPNHISAYCLTVEPNTALSKFIEKGKTHAPDDTLSAKQFEMGMKALQENGYVHYEISNYCLPGKESKHNSSYWKGKSFLGIGPSAHSFNGNSRQWNIANNQTYVRALLENKIPAEVEALNTGTQFNEYVMTSLRTHWGCNLEVVRDRFGEMYMTLCEKQARPYLGEGLLEKREKTLLLTPSGKLIADRIAADLFVVD